MESSWRDSDGCLKVILPRELMLLEPVFVLKNSYGETIHPSINVVNDSMIRLMLDEKPKENDQYSLLIYI